jgi:hypothetical protein
MLFEILVQALPDGRDSLGERRLSCGDQGGQWFGLEKSVRHDQ